MIDIQVIGIIGSRKEKLAVKVRPFIPDRLFYSLAAKKIHSKGAFEISRQSSPYGVM